MCRPVNLLASRIRIQGYLSHMGFVYSYFDTRKVDDSETAATSDSCAGDMITRPPLSMKKRQLYCIIKSIMMRELLYIYGTRTIERVRGSRAVRQPQQTVESSMPAGALSGRRLSISILTTNQSHRNLPRPAPMTTQMKMKPLKYMTSSMMM